MKENPNRSRLEIAKWNIKHVDGWFSSFGNLSQFELGSFLITNPKRIPQVINCFCQLLQSYRHTSSNMNAQPNLVANVISAHKTSCDPQNIPLISTKTNKSLLKESTRRDVRKTSPGRNYIKYGKISLKVIASDVTEWRSENPSNPPFASWELLSSLLCLIHENNISKLRNYNFDQWGKRKKYSIQAEWMEGNLLNKLVSSPPTPVAKIKIPRKNINSPERGC